MLKPPRAARPWQRAPVLASRDGGLAGPPRLVGADGMRLACQSQARGELEAAGWGRADRAPSLDPSRPLDVAFRLERDEYRGVSRLQLKLADVMPAGSAPRAGASAPPAG
jgi:single-stranded-DNA-specific exonuclease